MATLRGPGSLGMRWALSGVGIGGYANVALESLTIEEDGKTYIVESGAGSSLLRYDYDPTSKVTVLFTVLGASANTSASIARPHRSDVATITDSQAQITASFIVDTSRIIGSKDAAVKVEATGTGYELITT